MFELTETISIDAQGGRARGIAALAADHPLFADHFPITRLAPGSLLIELAAQIAGPLAEEITKLKHNLDRWALLGMIREAKFLKPVPLPARIAFYAEADRIETSNVTVSVRAEVSDQVVMRAQLVMMMTESSGEWDEAMNARDRRLATWKGAS